LEWAAVTADAITAGEAKTADDIGGVVGDGDPLRPTVCPRCDYLLTGLSLPGVCPECGRAVDLASVYLYGWPAGGRNHQWGSAGRSWGVLAFRLSCGLLPFALFLMSNGLWRSPWVFWGIPVALVGAALSAWQFVAHRRTGTTRVRLGPDGVQQGERSLGDAPSFEAADAAATTPWSKVRRVVVRPLSGGRVRITLSNNDDWWKLRTDYVDAVVRCPAEATDALLRRIAAWREDGR
jgi:hypothetical protein